ncbi:hypothetical protein K8O93_01000 [Gordonia bronchialis]|uniref:hypothetical protein n=1 Tax=Gordonia bronchialis TaxID=2054 RepID=UPI001CBDEC40|nr:hypothetical protein [Gordonia bronchialis]UAK38411.1 hypothetical protein K8O93_01000 [Gordonia bronchialis]
MAQPITESEVNPAAHWRYAVQYGHTMLGYDQWLRERQLSDLRQAVQEYREFAALYDLNRTADLEEFDEEEVHYLHRIRDAAVELVGLR